jgi:hypothetical protein
VSWAGGIAEWVEDGIAYVSVPFTWDLQKARQRCIWLEQEGYHVRLGGPAVMLMPQFSTGFASTAPVDALPHHNPDATFTSRGCIRRCSFCAVPKIEGDLVELETWPVKPIVCDNNLLACSVAHFDKVLDSLKPLTGIDFNQGLDARLLTSYHASRLAELDCTVRLAWDHIEMGNAFMQTYERLRKAHIPKSRIQCYVLIGYKDTPDDALFRLRTLHNMGIMPNPMRYNPLDAMVRDSYVAPHWTERELTRFMRYWANLRYTAGVPFEEFN